MKTFKNRIDDFEYYCDKLDFMLTKNNIERAEEFIDKIRTTGLNLEYYPKDLLSVYFFNNKDISAIIFFLLVNIKAKMNKTNYSLALSRYKSNPDDENLNIIISYYRDQKKGA